MPSSLVFISEGFPYALFDPADPDLGPEGPLRVDGWSHWLRNHPDRNFASVAPFNRVMPEHPDFLSIP